MAAEKVHTDWDSMRTDDPKVFAAGDGAFGPSTIVTAMYHGHRAAYYLQHYLEGDPNPLPYRTPYKTRRVPVAQDALWEVFAREHQEFRGLGDNPIAFPEIETTYDDEAAKREAARCYRCDAETGSADYSVRTREDIFVMARTKPEDARKQRAVFTKRLTVSNETHFSPQVASLDDIVFLPANLSRLVIDPYRDACRITTELGKALELRAPFLASGFDEAPEAVRAAVAHGLEAQGLAYVGRRQLAHGVPWLQLLTYGDEPHADADAVIALGSDLGARPDPPDGSATTSSSAFRQPQPSSRRRSRSRSSTVSTCSSSMRAPASPAPGPSSPARLICPRSETRCRSCAQPTVRRTSCSFTSAGRARGPTPPS